MLPAPRGLSVWCADGGHAGSFSLAQRSESRLVLGGLACSGFAREGAARAIGLG
jgi:hypothetical protein